MTMAQLRELSHTRMTEQQTPMRATVKARWVAELRSGTRLQGIGALRVGPRYCCLGVLCEIAVQDGIIGPGEPMDTSHSCGLEYHYGDLGLRSVLPYEVHVWAGLEAHNPVVFGRRLSQHNDDGLTFDQIADLIEHFL